MAVTLKVSAGVGEFIDSQEYCFGRTGWEVLASGKPLLQGFLFEDNQFEEMIGYPPPPMLPVKNERDVWKHLLFLADHPQDGVLIGEKAREWFETYNGAALATKWLEVLTDNSET